MISISHWGQADEIPLYVFAAYCVVAGIIFFGAVIWLDYIKRD